MVPRLGGVYGCLRGDPVFADLAIATDGDIFNKGVMKVLWFAACGPIVLLFGLAASDATDETNSGGANEAELPS